MKDINGWFLSVGVLFLTIGLLLPWVQLAPHDVRQQNRQYLVAFVASPNIPQIMREQLDAYGLHAQIDEQELLLLLQRSAYGDNFIALEAYDRLHVWHLLWLDVAWPNKVLLVLLIGWYAVSLVLLLRNIRIPQSTLDFDEDSYLDEGMAESTTYVMTPPVVATAVILLLYFFRLPYWDTLGHVGEWSMLLLDMLVGAKVAFAPRLLIPLGLLLIALSNLDSFINGRSQNIDLDNGEY